MKTVNELKKLYPNLDKVSLNKLIDLHNFHKFLDENKMQQEKAFIFLTNTLKNMYHYKNNKMVLKTLCETLVNENVIDHIENDNVILKDDEGRFILPKTAVNYIKHLLFENSISEYYKEKQKEKSELIYVDLNKIIEKGEIK